MNDATRPDLGETYPAGHPSGRIWKPPLTLEQADARVAHERTHLDESIRTGLDVGYAARCLDEVLSDFGNMVLGD